MKVGDPVCCLFFGFHLKPITSRKFGKVRLGSHVDMTKNLDGYDGISKRRLDYVSDGEVRRM